MANVVEKGATVRTIYLPAGCTWYDHERQPPRLCCGQTIEVPVGLGSIPMFPARSAVFATSEDVKHILRDTLRHLDLLIAAESDTSFVLYDDDGHTQDYEKGVFARTDISVKAGEQTVVSFRKTAATRAPWTA